MTHLPATRFQSRLAAILLAAPLPFAGPPARAGGTLTVAMTAGDLPIDIGQPDQGAEGSRFVGYNL